MPTFTWPAGIQIADARIAAGEPITEDLMHDYRDRDDYLQDLFDSDSPEEGGTGHMHAGNAGEGPWVRMISFYGAVACGVDVIVDATLDWRDKYAAFFGGFRSANSLANAQAWIPGGASDNNLTPTGLTGPLAGETMYTEDGTVWAAPPGMNPPYVSIAGPSLTYYIWVDDNNGNLKVRANAGGGMTHFAYNLMIIFSVDEGYY